jgi:hypothetical protein
MSFETISLLLSWLELGALLAILFRLGHTFELIANTQRELRRAIHHLGERRDAYDAFAGREVASVFSSLYPRANAEKMMGPDDLVRLRL